jgi:O-antigen ligase
LSSRVRRIGLFVISIGLLLFTQTRINILVLASVPMVVFLLERGLLSRKKIVLVSLAIFVFVYPLYQLLLDFDFIKEFLLGRYGGERDASFGMRYYLYIKSLELIQEASWYELLFGQGSETARLYILELTKEDSYSHNDFLRLIIDFGIIFTVLYLLLIIKIALKTNLTVVIFILYLSSFYHNMAFDFYTISCLVICSTLTVSFKPISKS